MTMNVIDVWQSMLGDNGGVRQVPGAFYASYDAAREASDGWGTKLEPVKELAIIIRDREGERTYLLKGPIEVYQDSSDAKKKRALSKLTIEERKLLGL